MASIFSQIIAGEVPAHRIAETKDYLAFLDIQPLNPGHTLVIPKKEVDYYFDLDDETYIGLNLFAKTVAIALKKAIPCERVATAVIGLEVPHAHLHLVPVNQMADMDWSQRKAPSQEELADVAERIRAQL